MVFSKLRLIVALCFVTFMTLTCVQGADAQQTLGGIVGTVTDASGSILPGVAVKLVEEGTNLTRNTVSNSAGSYAFPNLPIGMYTLTFSKDGFSTARFPGIVVQADQR